jgi:ectoine hydroxylase-related dioxygenase (phytanoyl-CoA dioxygenase family)
MNIRGNIDRCEDGMLNGWVCDGANPSTALELEVLCGNESVGSCMADMYRDDLEFAGFGDGRHGFAFRLPDSLPSAVLRSVRVRLSGSDVFLLQGGAIPEDDLLLPVYQHLSRFGGLWIDRLDWMDRLGLLTRQGVLSDAMGQKIMAFARDGYLILRQALDPAEVAALNARLDSAWTDLPDGLTMQTGWDETGRLTAPANIAGRLGGAALLDLHRSVPELAAALAAPAMLAFLAEIFADTPRLTASATRECCGERPFLQDSIQSDIAENPLASAGFWLALSPTSPGDDSPVLIAGSHHARDFLFGRTSKLLRDAPEDLERYLAWMQHEAGVNGYLWQRLTLQPGDIVVHHADLQHGVNPFSPDVNARGVSGRFVPGWLADMAPGTVA